MRAKTIAAVLALTIAALLAFGGVAQAKVAHVEEGSFGSFGGYAWASVDNSSGPSSGDLYVGEFSFSTFESAVRKLEADGTDTGVSLNGAETPGFFFSFVDFGTFDTSGAVAVDGSTGTHAGDVYLPDLGNHVVDVFDESGAYVCQITGEATPSGSECAGATGSETPAGGITPLSVVVDPANGDLYVGDASGVIYRFDEAGEYVDQISDPNVTAPNSLAIDSAGNLYVANAAPLLFGGGSAVKLDASGSFVETIVPAGALSVAVDQNTDNVYVGRENVIEEYDASGATLDAFGADALSLAVNQVTGAVYATNNSFEAEGSIWSGDTIIPDVTTEAATAVEEAAATLHAEVGPDTAHGGAEVESCEFEYGTTTSYESSMPCSPATPYASATAASANLSGLVTSTTYHFRVKAENANGIPSYGADELFITKGPPSLGAQSVDHIDRFSAEVHASVNPHGYATDWKVQYVDQTQYEVDGFNSAQETSSMAVGSQQSAQAVSTEVTGLDVETQYHYRVVATSSHGTAEGPDKSFETVVIAEVSLQWVRTGLHSAELIGDINPLGVDTICQVQWVSDDEYAESGFAGAPKVPCAPEHLGTGSQAVEAIAEIAGLDLATSYHYRFIAENSSGILVGEEKEFMTFGITKFSMEVDNEAEEAETRAGGRPYELVAHVELSRTTGGPVDFEGFSAERPTAVVKDILTELPAGMIGNPTAVPKCTTRVIEERNCSGDAQVGTMEIESFSAVKGVGGDHHSRKAIYNSYPPKGKPASFVTRAFNVSIAAFVEAGLRTGSDYGLDTGASNIIEIAGLTGVEVRMWGVPADESHDAKRECPGLAGICSSNAEPKPFLRNPTACAGPLTARAKANSFAAPREWVYRADEIPPITGCNQLEFTPSIEARPTTTVADSPSGLHVEIKNPQNEDPYGLGTPDVKDVSVALPEGMRVNPAGANGLEGCTEAQADLHSTGPGHCPDGSKIGTAEVDTPLLDHPLKGSMFLATPHDNPFGSLLATYIALEDEQTGVIIKLAGEVKSDPGTGRLTATFKDNPQLPFNDFKVDLFSGALAPLRTPGNCGTYSTHSSLTPWSAPDSGPPSTPSDSYKIESGPNGSGCNETNSPSFSSGTESPIAAKYSPFVVRLSRDDGSQEFKDVTITPPAGLVARLAGTPYCSDAALGAAAGRSGRDEKANSSCSSASEIGTVHVAAGAGPSPYWVTGHAYLAGPYQGAPLSMAIITPATAGPFDLGTVVVRSALHVDPVTTQITATTDEIPHILEGIPLDIRQANVILDKPGFTLNPTSCDATSIGGQLVSVLNQSASLSDRFQVGDCTSLSFEPKLGLRLYGKTNRGAHPKFRAVLVMPEGGANISEASVRLPRSEILDQGHIRTVCTRVQFAADSCPQGSIYGYARAWSPLLDQPLQGPVYLRSSSHKLPDLVADLNGQIHVEVAGRIDSVKGGIRNTFEAVPDAPVSKFVLFMKGGAKGLLQNSTNICKGTHRAVSLFDAHSGAVHDIRPALNNGRCRHKRKRHKRHHRKGAAKRSSVAVASRAG